METKSIEERAEEYAFERNCVKLYSDSNGESCKWICPHLHDGCSCESCEKDYFAYIEIATEQDRISRADERERCIKIAQDKMCSICREAHNNCGYGVICTYVKCDKRDNLREAMEGSYV